ncbi:MAG TPA: hypothetical protein DCM02_11085 [Flavobacterium sp.]|nr:hypothetical protein [Flavobacterium sp.]
MPSVFLYGLISAPFLSQKHKLNFNTMSQTASGHYRVQKWYNKQIFPLIPVIDIKKENENNTSGFSFRWLFFTFWSLDSFQFELSFNIDTHWGIGFTFLLPYLRGVIAIPCPEKLGFWFDRTFSRKVRLN